MNATEPQKADTFFKNLSPSMASYYNEAKKLSKKYEHFFIGQEHFLAAFFLNNNSVIRKYPRDPKWNAKKKIDSLLKASYAAQKNGCKWFKQNGFLVNPRMQDAWYQAIEHTKFKDSAEVHEIHVLLGIFERPNKPIVDWLTEEGLFNEAAIKSFIDEEIKNQDQLVYDKADVEEKPEKPKANPFGFLGKLFGGGKDKAIEAEKSFTADDDDEEDEARNASILYTDDYDFKHDRENSVSSYTPSSEPEYTPAEPVVEETPEPYTPPAPKPAKKKARSINIGYQFVYMEDELINRGMPVSIFERFLEINDKLGSVPEKVPFKGKKIYFDDLLLKNLSESEYEEVVNAMSSSADATVSKSPFRSSSEPSSSQHSLFKSKTSDKPAEEKKSDGVYEINTSSEEIPSFNSSSKSEAVPSFDSSSKNEEVPSFDSSSKNEEVPSFNSSSKNEAVPSFDSSSKNEEVPSFDSSSKNEEVPSFDSSSKNEAVPSFDSSSKNEAVPSFDSSSKNEEVPSFDSSSKNEEVPSFDSSSKSEEVPSFDSSSKNEDKEDKKVVSVEQDETVKEESKNDSDNSDNTNEEIVKEENQDKNDSSDEVHFSTASFDTIEYVAGSTPFSLYESKKDASSISDILKENGQYFVKTADEIQEGFHWSEMFDFTPINQVKMPQKSAKNDVELLSVGKIRRKA